MFDLNSVAVDAEKIKNGVWWEIHRDPSGHITGRRVDAPTNNGCLLIAPLVGIRYERTLDEARRPYMAKLADGTLDDADARKIEAKAMSECVLLDWRNIGAAGNEIPFSKQTAFEQLSSVRWTALFDFIYMAARNRVAILEFEEERAKGNLQSS